jgi:predicted nucleotidyltransferase
MTSVGDALFTKTQQRVLSLLFGKPDKSFYANEIMRFVDMGRGTVMRELHKLTDAGLLTLTRSGNQKHFQANVNSPVYSELLGIVRKTFGVTDVIRQTLMPLDEHIELAFVYGSMAKSQENEKSDIDLMLVGEGLVYADIMALLIPLEDSLQRPINPTLYTSEEFNTKRNQGSSFLTRVLEQPKWMIKGEIDDT